MFRRLAYVNKVLGNSFIYKQMSRNIKNLTWQLHFVISTHQQAVVETIACNVLAPSLCRKLIDFFSLQWHSPHKAWHIWKILLEITFSFVSKLIQLLLYTFLWHLYATFNESIMNHWRWHSFGPWLNYYGLVIGEFRFYDKFQGLFLTATA